MLGRKKINMGSLICVVVCIWKAIRLVKTYNRKEDVAQAIDDDQSNRTYDKCATAREGERRI